MNAESFLLQAKRKSGVTNIDSTQVYEALSRLIDALHNEAKLSQFGRMIASKDIERMLQNYFETQAFHQSFKDSSSNAKIKKPVFIIGMPRTGSSFLHNLLACDSRWRAPKYWETLYSSPPTKSESPSRHRIRKAKVDLALFHMIAPNYRKIYMYGAELAAECIAIMAMSFVSPRFGFTYNVPSYWNWISKNQCFEGYRFHKTFLEFLQLPEDKTQWLLKAPGHIMHLGSLLNFYPDCRLIFTHRHPLKAIPSIASNTQTLRKVFSKHSQAEEVGKEELERWSLAWDHTEKIRQSPALDPSQWIDLNYSEIVADPLEIAKKIYKAFKMEFTKETENSMKTFLEKNTQNKHGKHVYIHESFGLKESDIETKFSSYIEKFNLKQEA